MKINDKFWKVTSDKMRHGTKSYEISEKKLAIDKNLQVMKNDKWLKVTSDKITREKKGKMTSDTKWQVMKSY